MKLILVMVLVASSVACTPGWHHPILGTRVHTFTHSGVNFVHCSILMDRAQPQMAHDAIAVCQDEITQTPEPLNKK